MARLGFTSSQLKKAAIVALCAAPVAHAAQDAQASRWRTPATQPAPQRAAPVAAQADVDWQQFELMFRQHLAQATALPVANPDPIATTIASARLLREQNEGQKARQLIEQRLTTSKDRQLYFELAAIHLHAGHKEQARQVLLHLDRTGAKDDPAQRLRYQWAQYHLLAGNTRKARTTLTALLTEHPQFLPGYVLLSQSYLEHGKLALAKDVLMRAKDNGLDSPTLELRLGILALKAENIQAAKRHLTKVLSKQPSNIVARVNLGLALMSAGDENGAERELLHARKLDPKRSFCHFALGVLYQKQQKLQKAKDSYALALQDPSAGPQVRYNYAMLLFKQQKNDPRGLRYLFEVTQLAKPSSAIHKIARTLLAKADDSRF